MSILDKVYKAFSNLERDYARSKKSRKDFIVDKFGGDIDIGSMIILDAISNSACESQEDIEKLTYVKKVFEQIRSMKDSLDSVTHFSAFTSGSEFTNFLRLLEQSKFDGMGIKAMLPPAMWAEHKGVFHYTANQQGGAYIPLGHATVIKVYNSHMRERIPQDLRVDKVPEIGMYLGVMNHVRADEISYGQACRKMKAK